MSDPTPTAGSVGWAPTATASSGTSERYLTAFGALRKRGPLGELATIEELANVPWEGLYRSWPNSGSDWNAVRRAVSRFLTMPLGDTYHPFRRSVVQSIPKARENRRVPDITPELFWEILDHVPEHYRPCYVTLVATGMRVGEYLAVEDHHLLPHTHQIAVPGTKTEASQATVSVDPCLWEWVGQAIPSPIRYKTLYRHWEAACRAVGAPDLVLA